MPPILRLDIPEHRGEVDVKTAYVPGLDGFAIKISPGFFDNPKLGLPSSNGLMILLRRGPAWSRRCCSTTATSPTSARRGRRCRGQASLARGRGGCHLRRRRPGAAAARGADPGPPIGEARIWAREQAKAQKRRPSSANSSAFGSRR